VDVAVLVPVKRFGAAKGRLAPALLPDQRAELARWMAAGVVAAAGELPVFVACDDEGVRTWAEDRGATVLWGPGLGLNGAIDDGVADLTRRGYDHVVIVHADLPLPGHLVSVPRPGVVTLVPDRRRDGTNAMAFPTNEPVTAGYGAGSFRRHLADALARGSTVEVRHDVELSLDVDTPADLAHPLLRKVLPSWLPTIPASPSSP
jgi:2-phospho-L-lactate guanylyltransferase